MNNLKNNKFCDTLPVDIFVDKEYVKLMWEKYISLVSFKRCRPTIILGYL